MTAHGDAATDQFLTGSLSLRGDLPGMVELGDEPDGTVPVQNPAQARVYPLGQDHRDPGADADDLDMRDATKAGQDPVQAGVTQGQGIAAGKEHLADLGVEAQIGEGLFLLCLIFYGDSPGPEALPETVSAVYGATVRG